MNLVYGRGTAMNKKQQTTGMPPGFSTSAFFPNLMFPFLDFLTSNYKLILHEPERLSEEILAISGCHPYYIWQLAWLVWERVRRKDEAQNMLDGAVEELLRTHDMDYERIWMNFNKTDKKMLIGLSLSDLSTLSDKFLREYNLGAISISFSTLKRLTWSGYVTQVNSRCEIDYPFFRMCLGSGEKVEWIFRLILTPIATAKLARHARPSSTPLTTPSHLMCNGQLSG
jgi:hypothetical protein